MAAANIIDYVDWRGDLTIAQSGLNEVDGLVLSMLTFLDLTGIVPEKFGEPVPLREALKRFFRAHPEEKIELGTVISGDVVKLARRTAASRRFGDMGLTAFRNIVNPEKEEQFCALTFLPGDGTRTFVFRGTGNDLVGWKENFNMSFMTPVPSQTDAVEYLKEGAAAGGEPLRLCGHSKGGNMAVYAAAFAPEEVQRRITEVWSDDGPGFPGSVLDSEGYLRISGRVRTLVPQSSIVGMLLEHSEDYEVVRSFQVGALQHDAFTWEVRGPGFIHMRSISGSSRFVDASLNSWLAGLSREQREQLCDALYQIFDNADVKRLEFGAPMLKKTTAMLKSLRDLDKESRSMLTKTLGLLFKEGTNTLYEMITGTQDLEPKLPEPKPAEK